MRKGNCESKTGQIINIRPVRINRDLWTNATGGISTNNAPKAKLDPKINPKTVPINYVNVYGRGGCETKVCAKSNANAAGNIQLRPPGRKETNTGRMEASPGRRETSPGRKEASPGKDTKEGKKEGPGTPSSNPGQRKAEPGKPGCRGRGKKAAPTAGGRNTGPGTEIKLRQESIIKYLKS